MAAELRKAGVPEDQITAAAAAEKANGDEDGIEVWPDNWTVLRLFLSCETQWRIAIDFGVTVHLGLDYAGVDALMRRLKIRDRDGEMFADQYGVKLRYRAGSWSEWDDLDPLHGGYLFASPWESAQPAADGLYTFGAMAVDADGNEGPPVLHEISTQPTAPVAIGATINGEDIDIIVTMSVVTDSGYLRIYRSLASAAADTEVDVSGALDAPAGTTVAWTDVLAAEGGDPSYRYRARAENASGVTSPPTGEALP